MATSMLDGLPSWVRGVAVVGFPVLVALYLLLSITGAIPSALSSEHDRLSVEQRQAKEEQNKQHDAQGQAQKEQSSLLRLICANTAKSEAVALECLRGR